jgi:hypothetical protein
MRPPSERLISRPTNCQAQRSNAPRATSKLHSTSQAGEIRKIGVARLHQRHAGVPAVGLHDERRNPAVQSWKTVSEENGRLSSSARKECESLSEACMAFGLDDLAMSHNDAFEWPSKDIFY